MFSMDRQLNKNKQTKSIMSVEKVYVLRPSEGLELFVVYGGESNPGPCGSKMMRTKQSHEVYAVFYRHDNKYAKLDAMTHTIQFVTLNEFKSSPLPCVFYKGLTIKYRGLERSQANIIVKKYLSPELKAQEMLESQGGIQDFLSGVGAIIGFVQLIGKAKLKLDASILKICTSINAIVMSFLSLIEKVTPTGVMSFISVLMSTLSDYVSTHILKSQSYEPLLFSIASAYIPDTILNIIKRMSLFTSTKICDEAGLIQDVVEVVFTALAWMQEQLGNILPKCLADRLNGVLLWMTKRSLMMESKNVIKKYANNPNLITNPFFCEEVRRVQDMWRKDSESLDWIMRSPFIKSIKEQIDGLMKAIIAQENITRQEPLMFVFEGPPGVMKSVVMNAVVEATEERAYSHTIKGLNDGKDFYDTYNNEEIFFMDDVGQQGISQWRNFINFVSCVNYKLDCADKDKKDTKFFTSSKIFVTTNAFQHLHGLTKADGISDITALWRRGYVFDFSKIKRDGGNIVGQVQFKYFNTVQKEFLNAFPSDLRDLSGDLPKIQPFFNVIEGQSRVDLIAWVLTIVKLFEEQRKNIFSVSRLTPEERMAIKNIVRHDTGLEAQGKPLKEVLERIPYTYGDVTIDLTRPGLFPVGSAAGKTEADDTWISSIKDVISSFIAWLHKADLPYTVVWWVWLLATITYYVSTGIMKIKTAVESRIASVDALKAQYEEVVGPLVCDISKCPTNVQAIVQSTYQVEFKDGSSQSNSACLVSGHYVIVPYHVVPHGAMFVSIRDKSSSGLVLDNMPFTEAFASFVDDVMVLELPRNIPSYFKNISHLFGSCNISKVRWLATPIGPVRLDETVSVREEGFNYKDKSNVVRTVAGGVRYSFGMGGLCGSPLIDQTAGIVGMHIAGDPGGAARFFSASTLLAITTALDSDKNILDTSIEKVLENGVVLDARRQVYVNDSSSLKPTPLKELLDVTRRPADLKKFGKQTVKIVAQKSFVKTGSVTTEELSFAEKLLEDIIPKYSKITEREVVLGNDHLAKINPDSSNGYGCLPNKTDYINYENGTYTEELKREMEKIAKQVETNTFVIDDWLWTECLKDEIRNDEKEGVPRSFRIGRVPLQVYAKELTGDMVAQMMKKKWDNGIMIGVNPYVDWDKMYKILAECEGVFDGDIAKWDGGMLAQLQHLVAKVVARKFIGTPEETRILEAILNNVVCTPVVISNKVYVTTHSMPSGCFWTALFNSIINRAYSAIWYYRETIAVKNTPTLFEFKNNIVDFVYGDDKVVGVRKKGKANLTASSMATQFANMGLGFTDANKNQIDYDFIPLHTISFLKRTFAYHPDVGRVMCPLSKRTLMNSLAWYDSKKDLNVVMRDKFSSFQRELYLHTDENFNELVEDMRLMLELFGFEYTILSKSYLVELFKDTKELITVPWHSFGKAVY